MLELTPVLILGIIFGAIVAIVYLGNRKKERMAMLEKGVDPSVFLRSGKNSFQSLKYGMLLIGLGLGIMVGKFLTYTEAFRNEKEAAYFAAIFLFGGAALVFFYFMEKRRSDAQRNGPSSTLPE
jgi:membrane associated rhomboid family serine protease